MAENAKPTLWQATDSTGTLSTKMPRPKSQNTDQRILDAAASKFFAHGFYKISIDELVAHLRTSKSTIYNHFNSKEGLVEAVLERFNQQLDDGLESIVHHTDHNFKQKLEAVTELTGRLLSQVGEAFWQDLKIHMPERWEAYQDQRVERLRNFYGALLKQAISQGLLRTDIDEDFMLLMYTKLSEIVIQPELLQTMSLSNVDAYRYITQLFLEGTLTPVGRSLLIPNDPS